MEDLPMQPAVVVGVDGSAAALRAALWAVDEAVSRDIPLRLVHILESGNDELEKSGPQRANAEQSIGRVVRAVEATDKTVKIETDIMRGRPAATLIHLSRHAEMICVGGIGSRHFQHGRIGSTAAALAGCAHCAVAIIHGGMPTRPNADVVLVATDDSPDTGILLKTATHEAAMRGAPLRVITCWQPPRSDPSAVKKGDLEIEAQLNRRMARWLGRYPNLRAEAVAVHGDLSDYLTTHAAQLQLVIVSARGPNHVRDVVGTAGYGALATSDCVVLVVDHQHL
jgi:nucleotide-binding universal stress UspA family protein